MTGGPSAKKRLKNLSVGRSLALFALGRPALNPWIVCHMPELQVRPGQVRTTFKRVDVASAAR